MIPRVPELPEVETVARQLAPRITGRAVRGLTILDPRLAREPLPPLSGRTVRRVSRAGKRVLIEFSGSARRRPLCLAVHLRMTGRLVWHPGRVRRPADHLRARLVLSGGELLFCDPRRFGTFDWYADAAAARPAAVDPVTGALTPERLARLIGTGRQSLKAFLLRQDRLVGLGNIYASEILAEAGLSPLRAAGSLAPEQVSRLHAAIRRVLRQAIRACGTTFSDFQDARGVEGGYRRYLRVYGREGEPCRRCGAPIERLVQQQRGTFLCPRCQR